MHSFDDFIPVGFMILEVSSNLGALENNMMMEAKRYSL